MWELVLRSEDKERDGEGEGLRNRERGRLNTPWSGHISSDVTRVTSLTSDTLTPVDPDGGDPPPELL